MARSKAVDGPYETHPNKHLITAASAPTRRCSVPATARWSRCRDGSVYHTHLCGRPLKTSRACASAGLRDRAAALCLEGRWLALPGPGGPDPAVEVEAAATRLPRGPVRRNFKGETQLPIEFQWLRTPYPDRLFKLTGSALQLTGRESLGSW